MTRLRVCIRRGAAEVGGSCVELESDGRRLVVDLGLPLDARLDHEVALPQVAGLDGSDPSLVGLVISHGHPDHWGLVDRISRKVPIYIGQRTADILREAKFFTPLGTALAPASFLADRESLQIGPFRVTPYLVDHSAFDAYAILVEAGGRRVLYSGDLRGHGRRGALLDALIADPPLDVDVLMLEGTHVDGRRGTGSSISEGDAEDRCAELFATTAGMALVAYSPQNVDRMITLHRAARRAGRKLVLDLYAASVAAASADPAVPQADWPDVCVYVPQAQRIKVKRAGEFRRVEEVRRHRIFPEQLAERAHGLVMTFRASMAAEFEQVGCLDGAAAVWSMWAGYLEDGSSDRLKAWLARHGIALEVVHASGHATVADLQRFAAGVRADRVAPIHTRAPQLYEQFFDNVERHDDGEWWEV